jgi:hypothetical protein
MPVLPQMGMVVPFGTRGHGWNARHKRVPMGMEYIRGLLNAETHKDCCQVGDFFLLKIVYYFLVFINF